MGKIIFGQISLIICCIFYLIWWSRCYRPGVKVNRVHGINGVLLALTAAFGVAGVVLCLLPYPEVREHIINIKLIVPVGIAGYVALLLITRLAFHRQITTELVLITGWTMLEVTVADRLYAAGGIGKGVFLTQVIVIAAAFIISMILYVAYYRMEENKAFYAAMVPLVTEALAMLIIVLTV